MPITTASTDIPADTGLAASTPTSAYTQVPSDTQEIPTPPTQQYQQPVLFLGTLTYRNNAADVLAGADVCAYLDSELRGNKVTTVDGQYGIPPGDFNPLTVTGDSADNGENITFTAAVPVVTINTCGRVVVSPYFRKHLQRILKNIPAFDHARDNLQ